MITSIHVTPASAVARSLGSALSSVPQWLLHLKNKLTATAAVMLPPSGCCSPMFLLRQAHAAAAAAVIFDFDTWICCCCCLAVAGPCDHDKPSSLVVGSTQQLRAKGQVRSQWCTCIFLGRSGCAAC